jgi:hypothetical protein
VGARQSCLRDGDPGWRRAWRSLNRAVQCPACGQLQAPAQTCANQHCKVSDERVQDNAARLVIAQKPHHLAELLPASGLGCFHIFKFAQDVEFAALRVFPEKRLFQRLSNGQTFRAQAARIGTRSSRNHPHVTGTRRPCGLRLGSYGAASRERETCRIRRGTDTTDSFNMPAKR